MAKRTDHAREAFLAELTPGDRRAIRTRLLRWYDRHKRDLPWRRREHDPYAQLLAEFMLQQTQVATVIDYFERFIRRFPTVRSLSDARLDEVLTLWSGLGYYRRARHLHAAARHVVEQFDGVIPSNVDELMRLPGVGRYTAGAIASVAFNTRAPVLDGNVTRVLLRLVAVEGNPKSPALRDHLWQLAEELLPRKRCGHFNQALMELGATVCSPTSPDCARCPLRRQCRAYSEGMTYRIPPPTKRARVRPASAVVVAVQRGKSLLFVRRPDSGLWAGLWELPAEPLDDGERPDDGLKRLTPHLPIGTELPAAIGEVRRQLTHRRYTFHVYLASAPARTRKNSLRGSPTRWLRPDERPKLPLSRATEAILDHLLAESTT